MSTQTTFLTAGATSKTVDIALVQKAAATSPGDPITGLVFNTASLTAYQRSGATSTGTAITLATQTVGGAYSSGGFVEIDATHMPGLYRFDVPNTLISAAGETNITFTGAANLATHTLKIIVTTFDLYAIGGGVLQAQLANAVNADGTMPTLQQAVYLTLQTLQELTISGTAGTVKAVDGSTTLAGLTYNAATGATSVTRSS